MAKLEASVGTAWWRVCGNLLWFGENYLWLGERRAFTPLNGDPRFEAIKARCRSEIHNQRKLAGIAPAVLK